MKTSKITFTVTPLAFNPVHGRLWPMPAYSREIRATSLAEAIRHAKAGLSQWRDRGETMAATSCEAFTVEYAGVGGTQTVEVSLT